MTRRRSTFGQIREPRFPRLAAWMYRYQIMRPYLKIRNRVENLLRQPPVPVELTVTADTADAEARLADLQWRLSILDAQHVQDAWPSQKG